MNVFDEFTEAGHTSLVELERLRKDLIDATLHNQAGDFVRHRQATLVFYNGKKVVVREYTVLEPSYLYNYSNQVLSVIA